MQKRICVSVVKFKKFSSIRLFNWKSAGFTRDRDRDRLKGLYTINNTVLLSILTILILLILLILILCSVNIDELL